MRSAVGNKALLDRVSKQAMAEYVQATRAALEVYGATMQAAQATRAALEVYDATMQAARDAYQGNAGK